MNTGMRYTFGQINKKEPNFFIDNVFVDDFDSKQKAYDVFTGKYNDYGLNENPSLRMRDFNNLKVIVDNDNIERCAVSFYANSRLVSHFWTSYKYPSPTSMFNGYQRPKGSVKVRPNYVIDVDGINKTLHGRNSFSYLQPLYFKMEGIESSSPQSLGWGTSPTRVLEFPNFTEILVKNNSVFNNWRHGLDYLYIPKLEVGNPAYNNYFYNWCIWSNQGMKKHIYINPEWETANNGSLHESLVYVLSKESNTQIRFVTNYDKPNSVNDLSVSNIGTNNVTLNFTEPPINTNINDFWEVWIDDGTDNIVQKYFPLGELQSPNTQIDFRYEYGSNGTLESKVNGLLPNGLKPNTVYTIMVRTVDFLYNKSPFSNKVIFKTNQI